MTFRHAYSGVRRYSRFVTLAAALPAIYWLSLDLIAHVGWFSRLNSVGSDAVREYWAGFAFIAILTVLFAVRLVSLFLMEKASWLDDASPILTWGGVLVWFVVTGYLNGRPYWFAPSELPCNDCTVAFVGVAWLSWLNYFLIGYLFLGPVGWLSELSIAFWLMKNAVEE